jgi:hypothetical protein
MGLGVADEQQLHDVIMAAVAAWLDDLDLHVGPPEAAMGTRALDPDRWLWVDDEWAAQREEARALLAGPRRGDVLVPARLTGALADAADELGARLDEWLAARCPSVVDVAHAGEALAAARARVAEDVCLVVPGGDGWVLAAGAVCFPSYWRLDEKIGRPLAHVHGPVPGYAGALAGRVDRFLGRLRPGQGVWRRNWSIHHTADLFVPAPPPAWAPPAARWLRSEYQTLVRLSSASAVAFTIRTQQVQLAPLASVRPDVCAALAAALRSWTPAQRAYKGGAVDDALVDWLDPCV